MQFMLSELVSLHRLIHGTENFRLEVNWKSSRPKIAIRQRGSSQTTRWTYTASDYNYEKAIKLGNHMAPRLHVCVCVRVHVHAQLSCCLRLCRCGTRLFLLWASAASLQSVCELAFAPGFAVLSDHYCHLCLLCSSLRLPLSLSLSLSLCVSLYLVSGVSISLSGSLAPSVPLCLYYLSIYLSHCLSFFLSFFVSLSFFLSGELSEFCCCMPIFLSLHLSISLLICLFLCLFTHLFLFLLFLMIILFL